MEKQRVRATHHMRTGWWLVLAAVAWGCYPSHERSGPDDGPLPSDCARIGGCPEGRSFFDVPDGAPVPLDGFCSELAISICESVGRCDCERWSGFAIEVEACVARVWGDCEGTEPGVNPSPPALLDDRTRELIAEGAIRYDPVAARQFIDDFARGARGCGYAGGWLSGWTVRDLFSLGGSFVGTVEAGEPCRLPVFRDGWRRSTTYGYLSECYLGVCEGRCVQAVDLGEPCVGDRACLRLDASLATDEGSATDHWTGLSAFFERGLSPVSPAVPGSILRCGSSGRCEPLLPAVRRAHSKVSGSARALDASWARAGRTSRSESRASGRGTAPPPPAPPSRVGARMGSCRWARIATAVPPGARAMPATEAAPFPRVTRWAPADT